MTSQARLQKARAWLDRSDPVAAALTNISNPDDEEARARSRRFAEFSRQAVLDEYTRAGIKPVYLDPNRTMLVSLSMLLSYGWRIEQTPEGPQLTRQISPESGDA